MHNNRFLLHTEKFSQIIRSVFMILLVFIAGTLYAQNSSVSVISIEKAQSIQYQKDSDGNGSMIVLTGNVEISVTKDDTKTVVKADKVSYNRETEMLYATGNVSLKQTGSSAAGGQNVTADSLLFNTSTLEGVFDNGRVIQTQSDAINLPSGSTLIVASSVFGRDSSSTIAFKDALLTFCDDENPHWRIKASRIWLLPGGEFAFLNALLYVGEIPLVPLPAFYYPKDELIFNPVFGYNSRTGYYIQNTYYIIGRKPLNTSSSSSSSSDVSEGLFNFMRATKLKEQVREGLIFHNLDEDYNGNSTEYLKIMADYYTNLGGLIGAEGVWKPKSVLSNVEGNLNLGFSNTIFKQGSDYVPFSSAGIPYYDWSNFMGLKVPLRYSANLKLSMNKPFSLTVNMPVYSDPFFTNDFGTRSESMDWIGFIMSGAEGTDDSVSEKSSFTWSATGSYTFNIPKNLNPYISSLSISSVTAQLTFTSKSVDFSKQDDDGNYIVKQKYTDRISDSDFDSWKYYSPERKFYYPSQVTPFKLSARMSGTLVKYSSSSAKTNQERINFAFPLVTPYEFNTPEEKEKIRLEEEKKRQQKLTEEAERNQVTQTEQTESSAETADLIPSENGASLSEYADTIPSENIAALSEKEASVQTENNSASSENTTAENTEIAFEPLFAESEFPRLDTSAATKVSTYEGLVYTLSYSITPDFTSQINYDANKLSSPEDFNFADIQSTYYQFKMPATLTSVLGYRGSFLSLTDTLNFNPLLQDHPNLDGYTETNQLSTKKTDYSAWKADLTNTNSLSIRPLIYNDIFKGTGIDWSNTIKLTRLTFNTEDFLGDNEDDCFKYLTLIDGFNDGDPENYITVNTLSGTLSAVHGNFSEKLTLSTKLPPQNAEYNFNLALNFPIGSFEVQQSISENSKSSSSETQAKPDAFTFGNLAQTASLHFFDNLKTDSGVSQKLSVTESLNISWEEKCISSAKLALTWRGLQLALTGQNTYGYDFISKEMAEENPELDEGWSVHDYKEFLPVSLSLAYSTSTKTYYRWNNRISWTPSLSTSIVYDCLRPTNSYFKFIPSLTFKINDFLNLTFSSESKNSVIFRYIQDWPVFAEYGSPIAVSEQNDNAFIDLLYSFDFFDGSEQKHRKMSGYKLQSLTMKLTHNICDWDFSASFSVKPRLLQPSGAKPYYDFSPYFTISVIWKPLPSMKTEIVDEYGTWKLNP